MLLVQNDLTLLHSKKEAELTSRVQELEGRLQMELMIGQDSAVHHASLLDRHTAALAELDEMRTSNDSFREQLPMLQAQLSSAQRELEQQSRSSAALMTDSARASKLEADFSASLQHSKKLQEQLIASESIVTAATAAKNDAEHKALKATQAHDALSVEFTLLKSDCIAKDAKIRSLQESSAMLKEAVLLLTQKNESLADSLRGTDMMNSDAVSIIDSLHAKERQHNEEKVLQLLHHAPRNQHLIFPSPCAGVSSIAGPGVAESHSRFPSQPVEGGGRGRRARVAASDAAGTDFEVGSRNAGCSSARNFKPRHYS